MKGKVKLSIEPDKPSKQESEKREGDGWVAQFDGAFLKEISKQVSSMPK